MKNDALEALFMSLGKRVRKVDKAFKSEWTRLACRCEHRVYVGSEICEFSCAKNENVICSYKTCPYMIHGGRI